MSSRFLPMNQMKRKMPIARITKQILL